ncbi:hypothetical protein KP509_1Z089300 [Ceratopteris richardii]|nr:hypothetical protein KP509_1Z089300 [Ceratopteris richardii]
MEVLISLVGNGVVAAFLYEFTLTLESLSLDSHTAISYIRSLQLSNDLHSRGSVGVESIWKGPSSRRGEFQYKSQYEMEHELVKHQLGSEVPMLVAFLHSLEPKKSVLLPDSAEEYGLTLKLHG